MQCWQLDCRQGRRRGGGPRLERPFQPTPGQSTALVTPAPNSLLLGTGSAELPIQTPLLCSQKVKQEVYLIHVYLFSVSRGPRGTLAAPM